VDRKNSFLHCASGTHRSQWNFIQAPTMRCGSQEPLGRVNL
jgi:hypothetical protein